MTAREAVCLNESVPQLQVPQAADTYLFPRDCAFTTAVLTSSVADGASAVGFTLATANTFSTSGSVLQQWKNGSTGKLNVNYNGLLQSIVSGWTPHVQAVQLGLGTTASRGSTGQYSFTAGYDCEASGAGSVAIGQGCLAQGPNSVVLGSGTASGSNSVAIGGTASGVGSAAIGYVCTVSANHSYAFGHSASVATQCTIALGGGTDVGVAMACTTALEVDTTNATPTKMLLNTGNFVIPADSAWCFSALIVARSNEADGNVCAVYKIEGGLKRDESNNTALIGTPTVTTLAEDADAAAGGWDVSATADDTNEMLSINVTGEASTTIRWVANVTYAHVTLA